MKNKMEFEYDFWGSAPEVKDVNLDGNRCASITKEEKILRVLNENEVKNHEKSKACHPKPIGCSTGAGYGERNLPKKLKKASRETVRAAFQAVLNVQNLFQNSKGGFVFMMVCLLAPIYDLLFSMVGGLSVSLTGIHSAPPILHQILRIFGGDQKWKGRNWRVVAPHILQPFVPLGGHIVSADAGEYAFVEVEWRNRTMRLPCPYLNRAVVLDAGLPVAIRKAFAGANPLAIPIWMGNPPMRDVSRLINLNGTDILVFDETILAGLAQCADLISALIGRFAEGAHDKPKRFLRTIEANVQLFIPQRKEGRFTIHDISVETQTYAVLLAVLREFLSLAVDERYCDIDLARAFLNAVWVELLPESAPKSPKSDNGVSKLQAMLRLDDAETFMRFLLEYIERHHSAICRLDEPWHAEAVGLLRAVKGQYEPLLIFQRQNIVEEYRHWVTDHGGDTGFWETVKTGEFPAKLQRRLKEAGIPFRDSERDITWKYQYYPKSVNPQKVAALALPVHHMVKLWRNLEIPVGTQVEQLLAPECLTENPDIQNVADSLGIPSGELQ